MIQLNNILLLRDAMQSTACALMWCPSVTFVNSNRMLRLFPPLDGQTIPVFPYQTSWQYSDGDPPNGGV